MTGRLKNFIVAYYTFNEENYCKLVVTNSTYINKTKTYIPLTTTTYSDGNPSPALGQAQL